MNTTNSPVDSLIAVQPETNATVSASAGSGKTWLLVTRIIRLLLADTEPGSILALTFTRKAAAEMQMRLQERLYQMSTADNETLSKLLIQSGCENTTENIKKSRVLYENLLHADFPVRLQTFHSFCQDILSHFPLEADITPGFELIESTALLQQQAWEALFADATREPDGELANDLDVLMQACNGPANTRAALDSMLDHRNDWWAYTESTHDAAAFASDELQKFLEIDVATDPSVNFFNKHNREQLSEFSDLLRLSATKANITAADQLDHALQLQKYDETAFMTLVPAFFTKDMEPRSRKASNAQAGRMGVDKEAHFISLHIEICATAQQVLESLKRNQTLKLNDTWYRAGQTYIEHYQRLKREQRVLDFADLEWNCYRLLNTADNAHWIQYKIDQRINHVLIDEFQDTNPTQWQLILPLLQEIAAGEDERARSIFLVGDEKQSIYGFRRANPHLQQQASAWLKQTLSAIATPLDASRRSSPAIIQAVNSIFMQEEIQHVMPGYTQHATHLDKLPGSVSLFPLCVLENDENDEDTVVERPPLRNPLLEPRPENLNTVRALEAELIAEQIEDLIKKPVLITDRSSNGEAVVRPIDYGDIMILMRNRTHVHEYESVLRERNIPFIGSQRGSLLNNQEIEDLEKLLDSLITPFNRLSIAQVLKSPVFAASDEDLITLARTHRDSKWHERLQLVAAELDHPHPLKRAANLLPHWRKLADTMPVHDLLDRIYAEGNIIQRYVASVPATQQQRVKANLQRFHELSLELDSGRYPSLSHFLHYLRSIREHKDSRPDEPASVHEQSRVSVLTIHGSKGLESPVIILADCDKKGSSKNAYSAMVDWPAGSSKPERFQLLTTKTGIDSITEQVLQKKEQAQYREELNLLYVALTRARQHLLITGVSLAAKQQSGWYNLIENAMGTLTQQGADGVYRITFGSYDHEITHKEQQAQHEKYQLTVDPRLQQPITEISTDEYMIAPSLSFHHTESSALGDNRDESMKRGITIHRALDLMTQAMPLSAGQVMQQVSQEAAMNTDDSELENWIDEARNTIENASFAPLFKPGTDAQCFNELPIMYQHDGRSVYGIIDRLIIRPDEITLIDYKSHQVKDETELNELANSFKSQIQLYKLGVEKIWPGHAIKSGLLFTNSARLIWLDNI